MVDSAVQEVNLCFVRKGDDKPAWYNRVQRAWLGEEFIHVMVQPHEYCIMDINMKWGLNFSSYHNYDKFDMEIVPVGKILVRSYVESLEAMAKIFPHEWGRRGQRPEIYRAALSYFLGGERAKDCIWYAHTFLMCMGLTELPIPSGKVTPDQYYDMISSLPYRNLT